MRLLPLSAVFAFILAFAVPGTTLGSHAGPLTASCTNPEVAYTVNFPNNWFYNARVSGGGGAEDIEQCRYFSPNEFSLTPGSEPTGVSIGMGVENVAFDPSEGEQVTVGGRQAIRVEAESTTPGFEGMFYVYRIDLGGGQTLVARTSDRFVGDYEENKQILDAMMESLVFGAQPTPTPQPTAVPNTAMPANTGTGGGLVAAVLLGGMLALSAVMTLAVRRR